MQKEHEDFSELDAPDDIEHLRLFSVLLIMGALILSSLLQHSVLHDDKLWQGKANCQYEFVLQAAQTAVGEDMLLSIDEPVFNSKYEIVGLCIEKQQLSLLKVSYQVTD